ncbi:MAG: OmpA family protein [Alphaproteobacteria bacterium]|nr:OmpA family protein [Alphaproteobacteria bacterium]
MTNGLFGIPRRVLPVVAVLALAGCSDLDVFGLFDDDAPAAETAGDQDLRARGDAERAAAEDSDTPSLTSVPSRPAAGSSAVRDRVVEGLIADRNNARYTDEAIRLQGSTRAADVPQAASAPTPSAPPASVTTTPVPPAPATPAPAIADIAVTPPPPPQVSVVPNARPQASVTPQVAVVPNARPAARPESQVAVITNPRPLPPTASAVRPAATPPAAAVPAAPAQRLPAIAQSQSVSVDLSVLGGGGGYYGGVNSYGVNPYGGGYLPVSAQISPEAQVATIQFGHSSARLGARDRQIINAVASAYRNTGGQILVVGHASSRTAQMPKNRHELANFNVSFARANAVAQALIGAGIPPARVTVEAVSDDQPIYSEAMPTGEAGNRRAEIFVLR